jgi:hypothetical protein
LSDLIHIIHFVNSQEADLLVHDTIANFQRNKVVDLTLPWVYGDFVFLIPVPDESANINAVVKPFQWPVGIFKELPIIFQIQQRSPIRSPGLVRTRNIDRLRHRSFEFYPALLAISIRD